MAAVAGYCFGCCAHSIVNNDSNVSSPAFRYPVAAGTVIDAVAVPTLIAVGILAALSLLPLSPFATEAMIGTGILAAVPHILLMGLDAKDHTPFKTHKEIFFGA